MENLFKTMRSLHPRGAKARGLVVDRDGVMLGPDCVLVGRTSNGYSTASPAVIARLRRSVFADDKRLERLPIVLDAIAQALEHGDLVRAQLLGLEIPLEPLDDGQIERLASAVTLAKAGFNPGEPRDERGRWTRDGGGTAATMATTGSAMTVAAAGNGAVLDAATRATEEKHRRLSYGEVKAFVASHNRSGQSDALIIAIAYVESGFDPKAQNQTSTAGGLLGLTDPAIRDLQARSKEFDNLNRYDPAQNIDAGSQYLKLVIKRFHGNVAVALTHYGNGPAYARRVMAAAEALQADPAHPMQVLKQHIGPR